MSIKNLESLLNAQSVTVINTLVDAREMCDMLLQNLQSAQNRQVRLLDYSLQDDGWSETNDIAACDLAIVSASDSELSAIGTRLIELGAKAICIVSHCVGVDPKLLSLASEQGVRVLGGNSFGIIRPKQALYASASRLTPKAGKIAFVAQSADIVDTMLEWSVLREIGFSLVTSVGSSEDVDIADLLDYLALDYATSAILLHLEEIPNPRKFMSAARAASLAKPVILVKSGRDSSPIAIDQSTELSSLDASHDAAFMRAGLVRVHTLEHLFDAVETLSTMRRPRGNRLAIVGNGKGVLQLAVDAVQFSKGRLAELEASTEVELAKTTHSKAMVDGTVCLSRYADAEAYQHVLDTLIADRSVDGILVIHTPVSNGVSDEVVKVLVHGFEKRAGKTLFVCWSGRHGRHKLELDRNGIPNYETPEDAVRAFVLLDRYYRIREQLLEMPPGPPENRDDMAGEVSEFLYVDPENPWLEPDRARALLEAYEIQSQTIDSDERPIAAPIPLKLGVVDTPEFGPMLFAGRGGRSGELYSDIALGLPPMNLKLARELLERTRVLEQVRQELGQEFAERLALMIWRLAKLIVHNPAVQHLAMNPVLVDRTQINIHEVKIKVHPDGQHNRLVIRPYPSHLEIPFVVGDETKALRPIHPADEIALQTAFDKLDADEVRFRFFSNLGTLSHHLAARLTQLDYDRHMAFVIADQGLPGNVEIHGVVRLAEDPDGDRAEFAIIVAGVFSGYGIGTRLLSHIIEYGRGRGLNEIYGNVLANNSRMLALADKLGFVRKRDPSDRSVIRVTLKLSEGKSES